MRFKMQDRDTFAARVKQAVDEAGLGPTTYDPDSFALRSERTGIVMYLANIYARSAAALPWQRSGVLAQFVRTLAEISQYQEPTAEQARAMLLPRVRERVWYAFQNLRDKAEGHERPETPFREFAGGKLTLEVVLDRPDSVVNVRTEQLTDWGLGFAEALALANSNLLRLGTNRFRSPQPGLYVSQWNDTHDASRMNLPEVITALRVSGRPVAMIPDRNLLIVTGADDPAGLAAMTRIAAETLKQPKPGGLSGYAFRLDDGWTPFLPPVGHPAFVSMQRLAVQTLARDYEEQKHLLEAVFKRLGEDLFVASVLVEERTDGTFATLASWAQDVDTLLPKTDRLALGVDGPDSKPKFLGLADWDRVQEIMGDRMEPQRLYPERYRVRVFPSEAELRELGVV